MRTLSSDEGFSRGHFAMLLERAAVGSFLFTLIGEDDFYEGFVYYKMSVGWKLTLPGNSSHVSDRARTVDDLVELFGDGEKWVLL